MMEAVIETTAVSGKEVERNRTVALRRSEAEHVANLVAWAGMLTPALL